MTKIAQPDTSKKYKAEDLVKFTLIESENLNVYAIAGSNGHSRVRGLRIDSHRRHTLLAIANTLSKGLWWKGKETGNVPKYAWVTSAKPTHHLFIGRLAFMLQTKRIDTP